jgi:hypothetical protein
MFCNKKNSWPEIQIKKTFAVKKSDQKESVKKLREQERI